MGLIALVAAPWSHKVSIAAPPRSLGVCIFRRSFHQRMETGYIVLKWVWLLWYNHYTLHYCHHLVFHPLLPKQKTLNPISPHLLRSWWDHWCSESPWRLVCWRWKKWRWWRRHWKRRWWWIGGGHNLLGWLLKEQSFKRFPSFVVRLAKMQQAPSWSHSLYSNEELHRIEEGYQLRKSVAESHTPR